MLIILEKNKRKGNCVCQTAHQCFHFCTSPGKYFNNVTSDLKRQKKGNLAMKCVGILSL